MYFSHCNEPGCPGHYKSWERCDHLRAFGGPAGCSSCAVSRHCDRTAAHCPGLSGLEFHATRPTTAGLVRGI